MTMPVAHFLQQPFAGRDRLQRVRPTPSRTMDLCDSRLWHAGEWGGADALKAVP